jgi:hypothetical protein
MIRVIDGIHPYPSPPSFLVDGRVNFCITSSSENQLIADEISGMVHARDVMYSPLSLPYFQVGGE